MPSELKVVFFDLDDTLYDHTYHIRSAITALRHKYSFLQTFTVDYLQQLSHRLLEEVHSRLLNGELTVEESRRIRWQKFLDQSGRQKGIDTMEVADYYLKNYYLSERVVPGSIELLETLRKEYSIGIISNNLLDEQLSKMKRLGISDYIDTFAISEEVGAAKPDRRIFDAALSRSKVSAGEAVYIGDSWENDVIGALNVGIRPIWFNRNAIASPDSRIQEITSLEPIESVIDHIRNESATPQITRPDPASA